MGIVELRAVRLQLGGKPVLHRLATELREDHTQALSGPQQAGTSTSASALMRGARPPWRPMRT